MYFDVFAIMIVSLQSKIIKSCWSIYTWQLWHIQLYTGWKLASVVIMYDTVEILLIVYNLSQWMQWL